MILAQETIQTNKQSNLPNLTVYNMRERVAGSKENLKNSNSQIRSKKIKKNQIEEIDNRNQNNDNHNDNGNRK